MYKTLQKIPDAYSAIKGSEKYPEIEGLILFYQTENGVIIKYEVSGLPIEETQCNSPVFGFHIHRGSACTGNQTDAFANTDGHFDVNSCPHPYHSGDMPPLFSANGRAFSVFLTDRFTVNDIIGKTVIIHSHPDDFMSQPSGNSGEKMACGEIKKTA